MRFHARHPRRPPAGGGAIPPRRSSLAVPFALAATLALLLGMTGSSGTGPAAVRALGPLPDCRYDDIMTSPRGYADWSITLVDTILRVPKTYVPPDLVNVSQAGIAGDGRVRAVVIDDLRAMTEAAAAADAAIGVESAYRSYERQEVVFAGWVQVHGYKRALQLSARPGHSEHQLGITIDFRSEPGGSPFTGDWGTTRAGQWMKAHAWEYGWVMSYPRNKISLSCYAYEPWHYHYVGRDLAAQIHASGLTPREFLWANFTTAVVPAVTPRPPSTPRPTAAAPTPAPTTLPSPTPAPTLVPTATPTAAPPTAAPTLAPPTAAPTPAPTAGPADPSPITLQMGAAIGLAALAATGLLVMGWMVLRRGRS